MLKNLAFWANDMTININQQQRIGRNKNYTLIYSLLEFKNKSSSAISIKSGTE